jgi:hypothetical protein
VTRSAGHRLVLELREVRDSLRWQADPAAIRARDPSPPALDARLEQGLAVGTGVSEQNSRFRRHDQPSRRPASSRRFRSRSFSAGVD